MKFKTILLFYIFIFSFYVFGHNHNHLIENIVKKQSYLAFQNIKNDIKEGLFKSEESDEYTPLPSYKCQHERMAQSWAGQFKNVNVTQYDEHYNHNHHSSFMKMKSNTDQQDDSGSHIIRIYFNTSFLENDPYSCSYAGQKIMVGDSSTPTGKKVSTPCADDGTYNECIHTCTQADILDSNLENLIIQYIIPSIKNSLENLIVIPKMKSPDILVLSTACARITNGQCIYGIKIPYEYLTTGIPNYDMVIWVTSRPTSSKETIAYAIPCNQEVYINGKFGRPLAGSINFNPVFFTPFLKASNQFTFSEYIRVGIHEMTHALGFTSTLYSSYVNSKGFYDASTVVKISGTSPSGNHYSYEKYAITSPNVVNFIRQHYQCDSISYAELEDSGSAGTAGSHWEKRTAGEEYMIGYVSPIAPITNLSLALLQDTGWYVINMSAAEPFIWGRNLGCDWVKDQCSSDTWNYQGYFCQASGSVGCTPTRFGVGMCGKAIFQSSLPAEFQHFNRSNIGGTDSVADYCPYFQVFTNQPSTYYCGDVANNGDKSVGEQFGSSSRCFEYQSGSSIKSACWQQRCNDKNVEINIKGTWITCNSSGQAVTANGVTVICPYGGFAECNGVPIQVLIHSSMSIANNRIVINWIILLASFLVIFL